MEGEGGCLSHLLVKKGRQLDLVQVEAEASSRQCQLVQMVWHLNLHLMVVEEARPEGSSSRHLIRHWHLTHLAAGAPDSQYQEDLLILEKPLGWT